MKIALVHDHLMQLGGAERVLKAFAEMYPDAPIYTLMYDNVAANRVVERKRLRPSYLQKIPFKRWLYRASLPLMPKAMESLDLTGYDVVLSSASSFAKGVKVRPDAIHICYCHTPPRYLWRDTDNYVATLRYPSLIKSVIYSLLPNLRKWDYEVAQSITQYIANSQEVSDRIQKFYDRKSVVVYPPVTLNVKPRRDVQTYYLTGGRLVQYKRFDTAVDAFTRLKIPLVVFGDGPDLGRLQKRAGQNIKFVGRVSDDEIASLYAGAIAFIHPQYEDFGITAIEAMASGCPVIAYNRGGAAESVIDGETGVLYDEQSWEAIGDAVIRFDPRRYATSQVEARGKSFSLGRFQQQIDKLVRGVYENRG